MEFFVSLRVTISTQNHVRIFTALGGLEYNMGENAQKYISPKSEEEKTFP